MIESLTLALATPIVTAVCSKFYESFGSKLGEKAGELVPDKVKQLGKFIWEKCLRGKPGADEMLQKASEGSVSDQERLTRYLHQVLESDPNLKQEAQRLATEIYQQVNIGQMQGGEFWNVSGGKAEKNVFEDNKAPILKDVNNSTINISYGTPPQS